VAGRDREGLKALRQAVNALPARRRVRSVRTEATLPFVGGDAPSEDEYEEE